MWFKQENRELVRTELWRSCNRSKWRRLICCWTFLFGFHNMAAGTPTFRNGFALMRISRKR